METLISLSEAAKKGGLSVSTLRRFCNDGRVDAMKDSNGNWQIKESSLGSISESMKKSSRSVQGATSVQYTPIEGVLKDTLERMVEPLRKALDRETGRVEQLEAALLEARARNRELETKLESRETRIGQLQEERVTDIKEGAASATILQALLQKVSDMESQAKKPSVSKLTDTVGSLFSNIGKRQ